MGPFWTLKPEKFMSSDPADYTTLKLETTYTIKAFKLYILCVIIVSFDVSFDTIFLCWVSLATIMWGKIDEDISLFLTFYKERIRIRIGTVSESVKKL